MWHKDEVLTEHKKQSKGSNTSLLTAEQITGYYWELLDECLNGQKSTGTRVIGIQGPIGIGKTTLAQAVSDLLTSLGFKVANFSIDDFYASWDERQVFNARYRDNPYYKISRGMPGTHRTDALLEAIRSAKSGRPFSVPVFDKSLHGGRGDITQEPRVVDGRCDFVFLEGWCVGIGEGLSMEEVVSQNNHTNEVFRSIDGESAYYKEVFKNINGYLPVWDELDSITFLRPTDVTYIEEWRAEQEARMIQLKGSGQTREEIREFVKPFLPFSIYLEKLLEQNPKARGIYVEKNHLPRASKE